MININVIGPTLLYNWKIKIKVSNKENYILVPFVHWLVKFYYKYLTTKYSWSADVNPFKFLLLSFIKNNKASGLKRFPTKLFRA